MLKIKIISTLTDYGEMIETQAKNFGELKKELKENEKFGDVKKNITAVIAENGNSLDLNNSQLPSGLSTNLDKRDFTLFLYPVETKGGIDEEFSAEEIRKAIKIVENYLTPEADKKSKKETREELERAKEIATKLMLNRK
jgi:hypothetical protein